MIFLFFHSLAIPIKKKKLKREKGVLKRRHWARWRTTATYRRTNRYNNTLNDIVRALVPPANSNSAKRTTFVSLVIYYLKNASVFKSVQIFAGVFHSAPCSGGCNEKSAILLPPDLHTIRKSLLLRIQQAHSCPRPKTLKVVLLWSKNVAE